MFSSALPPASQSTRPKRTRQSGSTEDSLKPPQAKRKRSALRKDTFEPLAEASLNQVAGREKGNAKTNGQTKADENNVSLSNGTTTELTVRPSKKNEKRSERTVSALTLSSNDFYTVSQLPTLPEQLWNNPELPYSCTISPEHGYALALTHTQALAWRYDLNSTTPSPRDIAVFNLPFPPSSSHDPLPLAAFAARSANGEPGIVAVSSKWGKVVYWDSLTNASTSIPGQNGNGVQGSIPNLSSGEIVKEISSAEPAGFIITTDQGRVAHLTIRDQMGRPGINVQFLRKASSNSTTGLFGTIRNVFGGDRRRGIPIVKPAKSTKGQRDVVVVSEDCDFELWNTTLGVADSLVEAFSLKGEVSSAVSSQYDHLEPGALNVKILDVDLTEGHTTNERRRETTNLVVLAASIVQDQTRYFLIELVVIETSANVKVIHPIDCYTSPLTSSTWRPKLHVSKSQHLAFVFLDAAIVLYSLAKIKESPSSQLLREKHALPQPFQDCIRFQENTIFKILGYGVESNTSSCVFAVQGYGLVRVLSRMRDVDDLDVDEFEQRISAKHKLEQAVFFGSIRHNPLDLNSTSNQSFPDEEIQSAALEISTEIVSSTSKYLPKSTASVDSQLKIRTKAHDDLVQHLLKHFPSAVTRVTRFKLLFNGEKLAAAQSIWKVQEAIQRKYPLKDREMSYMDFTLRALHETRQKYPDAAKGEKDRVRHWLIHSVNNVDHLMSELVDCLRELDDMDVRDPVVVADYLQEAVDLWSATYQTVFQFREDNAQLYGLGDEVFQDGILSAGYPTNLSAWTSKPEVFDYGQALIYEVCKYLNDWWDPHAPQTKTKKRKTPVDVDGKPYDPPPRSCLLALADRLTKEVDLFSRLNNEVVIHAKAQIRAHETDASKQVRQVADAKREGRNRVVQAIETISKFNMAGAIQLAEKIQEPDLLVSLNSEYLRQLVLDSASFPEESDRIEKKIVDVQDRAETYFDRFGNNWAFAHFSQMVEDGELGSMITEGQKDGKQGYLTWFLKKSEKLGQHLGKISWMNDVVGERNFAQAEKTLTRVAENEETDVWSKRTEVCLAKLMGLAAQEGKSGNSQSPTILVQHYDDQILLLDIQQRFHENLAAMVGSVIDVKAAQDLAYQYFASRVVAKYPAFRKLLKSALSALVEKQPLSIDQLIDLLTLADPVEWDGDQDEDPGVVGHEFSLAIRAIEASGFSRPHQEALTKVVWRRALIRDDWLVLNDTSGKDDRQVEATMQQTCFFQTLMQLLMDVRNGEINDVKLFSPKQILASEVFPLSLQERFDESQLDGIRKDLEREQQKLKSFVDKGQLEAHYGGLVTTAENSIKQLDGGEEDLTTTGSFVDLKEG